MTTFLQICASAGQAGEKYTFNLLKQLFKLVMQEYWYHILLIEALCNNILMALVIKFCFLLQLLITCVLISVEVTLVVKNLAVNNLQWDKLASEMATFVRKWKLHLLSRIKKTIILHHTWKNQEIQVSAPSK
jgi:hypothetical protein